MQKGQFKNSFIKKYEKYSIIRTVLLYILILRSGVKRKGVSRLYISFIFLFRICKICLSSVSSFFRKGINYLRELNSIQYLRRLLLKNCPLFKKYYFEVPLPENISNTNAHLFEYTNYYLLKPMQVQLLHNVYLYIATDFGIIHKCLRINRKSTHGRWDKRNIGIVGNYDSMIFDSFTEHFLRNNNTPNELKHDNNYLLIHNWFNYYHWLTESYARLFTVKDNLSQYTLVLPETIRNNPYVNALLDIIGPVKIQYISNETTLRFKKLSFVDMKKYCDNYDPVLLASMREYICNAVKSLEIKAPVKNERIFINRKVKNNRNILNESEIFPILKQYGFEVIEFEDFSFYEQVMMMMHCKHLIGAHGSGLTNMLFMAEEASVFELHRIVRNRNEHHSKVYWRMAGALKHRYFCQFCDIDPLKDTFFTTNIIVDALEFENTIKQFLKKDESQS